MIQSALTTIDNPYDPFTQFREWFLFDVGHGYNSCAYLARLSGNPEEKLSDQENFDYDEIIIDRIIEIDPLNIYTKVQREVKEEDIHI